MSRFDSHAIVDWSGGNDTGPRPRRDAIWMGLVRAGREMPPRYLRNRVEAEAALVALIEAELAAGRRLFIGFDFPFGYPAGFARRVAGADDALALWDWLAARIEDGPRSNNRFDLAAAINARFPGIGPFWFNGLKREIAHLPRRDTRTGHGMAERRAVEMICRGAFSCWQLGGAGSVGGQVLTGLPVLARLRRRFAGQVAAWPFEPIDAPVVLVEIWPGLIGRAVKRAEAAGGIRDAHQVGLLARAVSRLPAERCDAMLAAGARGASTEGGPPEEGWIMGVGFEDELEKAATGESLQPPPLRNDCFALPAGVTWAPVDQALALLRERLAPVTGEERVPLAQALGRTLAAPVRAQRANPPLPNSAVDGYGFAHANLPESGDPVLPLVEGRAAAGLRFEGTVPPGSAIRILTGAALPEGVDTVVLQEDVTRGQGEIAFRAGLKPAANTRRAGEDVQAGEEILRGGRRLGPPDLALAAATGCSELVVRQPLRVAVISTGDELVEPGAAAGPGQIFDANRPMLLAMIERAGHVPVDLGRVRDDRAALRAALDKAAGRADAILTSGGASAGDEDHVSALLDEAGGMALWRIAIKPGRPLALGMWQGKAVFGLPGNPVAAMVTGCVFALPALGVLAGSGWRAPQGFSVPAGFAKAKKAGRREYLRARIREGRAEVFRSEGSGRVSGLSWAEGLVELPDEALDVRPGDPVSFLPWCAFGI